jgi:NADH-quinone oxidoreductase subunit L
VGFPGPEHHIAEWEWPMKVAMGALAVLAVVGGAVGIPYVSDALEKFLEPTFADSRFRDVAPTNADELVGLIAGAVISASAIGAAWYVYLRKRSLRLVIRERFDAVHTFLVHKWYFDELYDRLFVRPWAAAGVFARSVIESDLVQGLLVGGATGVVRAGSTLARSIQNGYLRSYALVLLAGLGGLALYFLIASS